MREMTFKERIAVMMEGLDVGRVDYNRQLLREIIRYSYDFGMAEQTAVVPPNLKRTKHQIIDQFGLIDRGDG